jgi:hypothetical protein
MLGMMGNIPGAMGVRGLVIRACHVELTEGQVLEY